jgi:hypothetical protein
MPIARASIKINKELCFPNSNRGQHSRVDSVAGTTVLVELHRNTPVLPAYRAQSSFSHTRGKLDGLKQEFRTDSDRTFFR